MAQQDYSLLLSIAPEAKAQPQAPAAGDPGGSADDFVNGVAPYLVKRESGGKQLRPDGTPVTSPKGAIGLWQVMPDTAKEAAKLAGLPFDDMRYRTDADYNEALGKAYLKKQYIDFGGDPAKALAAYNGGPGRVRASVAAAEKIGDAGSWLQFMPAESRAYTPAIMSQYMAGASNQQPGQQPAARQVGYSPEFTDIRPMATERSTTEAIKDNAIGLASGVTQGVKSISDAFGAGNAVSNAMDSASQALNNGQSQFRKDQRAERAIKIASAEQSGSAWEEIKANVGSFIEAPLETTLSAVGTSAPTILAAFIPGVGQSQAARLIMQGAIGAAQGAGAAKGAIYDAVRDKLIANGATRDDAEKVAAGAQAYDGKNGANIAANAILGAVAGTSGVEAAAGRIMSKGAAGSPRGVVGRAGMGVIKESPVEAIQGGGERATSNVALQNEGYDVPTMQGVAGQAALEGLASAPGGAAFGAMERQKPSQSPELRPVAEAAQAGGVLSRSALAGVDAAPVAAPAEVQAAEQAAAQAAAQPEPDEISTRAAGVLRSIEGTNALQLLREREKDGGIKASDFLKAVNLATNEKVNPYERKLYLETIEGAVTQINEAAGRTMIQPAPAAQAPVADPNDPVAAIRAAMRDPSLGLSEQDRAGMIDSFSASQRPGLTEDQRLAALQPALEIAGRARAGKMASQPSAQQTPALLAPTQESAAGTQAGTVAPAEQQGVAAQTGASDQVATTDAGQQAAPVVTPAAPVAAPTQGGQPGARAPGAGSAAIRKRKAGFDQLAANGFGTISRAEDGKTYMVNARTGQRIGLDSPADILLARGAIARSFRAAADQSPNSPNNDLKESSEGQNSAGNYLKPSKDINGYKLRIENPAGSVRRGVDKDGVAWESEMKSDYGYIEGTKAADGDGVDVVVGRRPDSDKIFVIDQVNEDGSFDEPKVVMGVTDESDARRTYLSNYEKGWQGLGAITPMTRQQFGDWLKSGGPLRPTGNIGGAGPAERAVFKTLDEARGYISAQRRAGGSVTALPLERPDGTFVAAIKGTPDYDLAAKQVKKRKRDEERGRTGSTGVSRATGGRGARNPDSAASVGTGRDTKQSKDEGGSAGQRADGDGSTGKLDSGQPASAVGRKVKIRQKGADGKSSAVQLDLVEENQMPESPQRDGARVTTTRQVAGVIRSVARAMGVRVEFFSDPKNEVGSDGFFNPADSVVYLNRSSGIDPMVVFGHEFMHKLRQQSEEGYQAFAAVVRNRVKDPAAFRSYYDSSETTDGSILSEERGGELEELVADLNGNLMANPKFWRDVFAEVERANGSKATGIIARMAATIQSALSRLLGAARQSGYKSDEFVNNIEAIRAGFTKAMAQYITDNNIRPAKMQAEILRAEQAVRKSQDRGAYGIPADAITVEGYHFSRAPRAALTTGLYGTGLQGSDRDSIMQHPDSRLRNRLYFYANKGTGIRPESGVGGIAHKAKLTGIYDADADVNRLKQGRDRRGFESAVLDAGYKGYLSRLEGTQPAQVILLGPQTITPEILGSRIQINDAELVPKQAAREQDIGDKIMANKGLPSGALTGDRWAQVLMATMPDVFAEISDVQALGSDPLYKDELASKLRKMTQTIAKSKSRAREEYAEVEAKYKGTDQWMRAPNGAPTNLTERQWVQVRTPSFQKWFGNWEKFAGMQGGVWNDENFEVSKVVDENGEPLVVYHGTGTAGFSEFSDPGGAKRGDLGIFATSNIGMARSYVRRGRARMVDEADLDGDFVSDDGTEFAGERFGGIYALFMSIRNPQEENFEGAMWNGERIDQFQVLDENAEPIYAEDGAAFFDRDTAERLASENPGSQIQAAENHYQTTDEFVRGARSTKMDDGAIIREVIDDGGGAGYMLEPSDVFVAFDPNQVKSADFNGGEFSIDEDDIRRSRARKPIPESVDNVTNVDASFEFANGRVFATNRDFKLELQKRALDAAKDARVDLSEQDERTENYLSRVGERDARSGLTRNANAVGWYNEKVNKALGIVSLIHPELRTDPKARFAFTWALAVTSNGLKVDKNFELAEIAYQAYKDTGRMPTDLKAGQTQAKINEALGLFNELSDAWGIDRLMDFMVTKDSVKQITATSGISISGEGMATQVYGAAILGPKIGNGFFMNLYGQFDQLTMDRWLMRTWGRWTGTLIENKRQNIKESREKLSSLIGLLDPGQKKAFESIIGTRLSVSRIDEVADAILKASAKPALRERMNAIAALDDKSEEAVNQILGAPKKNVKRESVGAELRKGGNSLAKYLDGQKEAPGGSKERDFIRKVLGRILGKLESEMPDLTMADLQAVLWYPEKRLYDAAKASDGDADEGYDDDAAPDYANAAAKLARKKGVSDDKIDAIVKEVDNAIAAEKLARSAGRGDRRQGEAGPSANQVAGQAARDGLAKSARDGGVRRSPSRRDEALEGAPSIRGATGPDAKLVSVAEQYARENGIDLRRQEEYVKVDPDRASRIASAYEEMRHDPQNPVVREAYENLIRQTKAQYKALEGAGYKFWFIDLDDAGNAEYASSPWNAMRDIRENQSMGVFPTEAGFGSGDTELDVADNPLLEDTGITWPSGSLDGAPKRVLANDLFRAVHDAFGHGLEGAGFRADGEENAWQAHVRLFTGSAVGAITTETRGQNSWLNFGPHGETNRSAKVEDTIFADQKTGLMPSWTWVDGRVPDDQAWMEKWLDGTPLVNGNHKFLTGEPVAMQLYHGTNKDFQSFDTERSGSRNGYKTGGISLTNNSQLAGRYGRGVGGSVMPVIARLKSPLVVRGDNSPVQFFDENMSDLVAQARSGGHDSIIVKGTPSRLGGLYWDGEKYSEPSASGANTAKVEPGATMAGDEEVHVISLSTDGLHIGVAPTVESVPDQYNPAAEDEVAELIGKLQSSRGLALVRAKEDVASHPMAERINFVNDNFIDILDRLESDGLIKINC